MRHNLILLAIVVAALLMSGCCGLIPGSGTSQDNGNTQDNGTTQGVGDSQDAGDQDSGNSTASPDSSAVSDGLAGSWTTNQEYGDLSDPGAALEDGTNGTWYMFFDDGTFRKVVLAPGEAGGITIYGGNYSVQGNTILQAGVSRTVYSNVSQNGTQSGTPATRAQPVADARATFRFIDDDTLALNDGGSEVTYHRVGVPDEDMWNDAASALAG